jgi:hypothetical protein
MIMMIDGCGFRNGVGTAWFNDARDDV